MEWNLHFQRGLLAGSHGAHGVPAVAAQLFSLLSAVSVDSVVLLSVRPAALQLRRVVSLTAAPPDERREGCKTNMQNRPRAVSRFLKKEISQILAREMKDPRLGFATVTRVEMSADLKHAKVYVSVYGSEKERESCLGALAHARGYIQHMLSPRIRLKYMPQLSFVLDRSIEYSIHIDQVIERLEDEERQGD
jgi:ribosome-binding factor A